MANSAAQNPGKTFTVATTGASGALYLRELLRACEAETRIARVNLVCSDSSLRVMAEELEIKGRTDLVEQLVGQKSEKIVQQFNGDIGANIASGSYPAEAMIVIPCSMGTLGRIANGIASHLIERAADVTLKERRPLILCVRETPLNKIHLRNMSLAADAGAVIFPLIPAFYMRPVTPEQMAQQFAYRVLAHLGLRQQGMYEWGSEQD